MSGTGGNEVLRGSTSGFFLLWLSVSAVYAMSPHLCFIAVILVDFHVFL